MGTTGATIVRESAVLDPQPKRTSRWVLALVLGIAVVLVGTGIAVGVYVTNYQPLADNAWGATPSLSALVDSTAVSPAYVRVRYVDGAIFSYGVQFTNYGRWAITLTDPGWIPATRGDESLFRTDDIVMETNPHLLTTQLNDPSLVPFRPTSIGPGESLWIVYRGHLTDCRNFAPGTELGYDSIPFTFRLLGVTRHADVHLGEPLLILAPPRRGCPARGGG